MGLIGNRYVEASDPGAVGTGYQWQETGTSNLYERDSGNSDWVLIGNTDQVGLGNLPTTGGAMSGAITGVTGWAPEDSPNFTTSAKRAGVDLADMNDLATLESNMIALMNAQIQSAFESLPSILVGNNVVVASSTLSITMAFNTHHGDSWSGYVTIPAPQYADGTFATLAECKSMVQIGEFSSGGTSDSFFIEKVDDLHWWVVIYRSVNSTIPVHYIVSAVRSGT